MTRTRRRRLMLVGGLLIGLAAAAALALTAFSQNLLYFYQPSEIVAGEVPPHTRFRIGGLVEKGSVQRGDDLVVRFALADCNASVNVRYKGALPDLFREGQGIVAYGALDDQGRFIADEVLAKHDENYMSPDVAESLKDDQGVSCMPANMQAKR